MIELLQIDVVTVGIDLAIEVAGRGADHYEIALAVDGDGIGPVGGIGTVNVAAEALARVGDGEVVDLGQESGAERRSARCARDVNRA